MQAGTVTRSHLPDPAEAEREAAQASAEGALLAALRAKKESGALEGAEEVSAHQFHLLFSLVCT